MEGQGKVVDGAEGVRFRGRLSRTNEVVIHVGGPDRVHRFAESQHDSLGFALYGDDFRRKWNRGIRRQDPQLQRTRGRQVGRRIDGRDGQVDVHFARVGCAARIGTVTVAWDAPLVNVTV